MTQVAVNGKPNRKQRRAQQRNGNPANGANKRPPYEMVPVPARAEDADLEAEIHDYCGSRLSPEARWRRGRLYGIWTNDPDYDHKGCCLYHNKQRALCRAYVEKRLPEIEGWIKRWVAEKDPSVNCARDIQTLVSALADSLLTTQWQYPELWISGETQEEADEPPEVSARAAYYARLSEPKRWKDEIKRLAGGIDREQARVEKLEPSDLWQILCQVRYCLSAYMNCVEARA